MENNHLFKDRFDIGEQFGEHEFNLDFFIILKSENSYDYEIYYYTKSTKREKIYLAYNCDILSGVIIFINGKFSEALFLIKIESNTKNQLNYKAIKINEREQIFIVTKQNRVLTEKEIESLVLFIKHKN